MTHPTAPPSRVLAAAAISLVMSAACLGDRRVALEPIGDPVVAVEPSVTADLTEPATPVIERPRTVEEPRGLVAIREQPPLAFVTWSFDRGAEGFDLRSEQAHSDISWDASAGRIAIRSDRQDPDDELFDRAIPALTPDTSFLVTVRWRVIEQGNHQQAVPIFLAGARARGVLDTSNSIRVVYHSYDSNLARDPGYSLIYMDESDKRRLYVYSPLPSNTEYRFRIAYDAPSRTLRMSVLSPGGVFVDEGSYVLGSNEGDGFSFGRLGVASAGNHGYDGSPEPIVVGWVDDITFGRAPR